MRLVTRQQWGARPPRARSSLARAEQRGTAVHYSAADADEQADHARCAGRVRGIQAFHLDNRGWSDIAYSYLACKHGFVFEGRGLGTRTAAQGTNAGNDGYHAVCFLGDDTANRDDVTDAGRQAIREAVKHCNAWARVAEVRPHSSFKATSCPGDDLRGWIAKGMPIQPSEEDDLTDDERELLKATAADVGRVLQALHIGSGPEGGTNQDVAYQRMYYRVKEVAERPALQLDGEQLQQLAERIAPLVAGLIEIHGHPALSGILTLTPVPGEEG
jgi:hypothetical protein